MGYERIMVIGCSGSGKSTLSKQLGKALHIDVTHLDKLFWRDNWTHVSREEFDSQLFSIIEKPQWIIDGNYNRTIPVRMEHCDTIIYLDFPKWVCLSGAIKRIFKGHGKVRSDMSDGCPEKWDREFLLWIWNFNKNFRKAMYEMIDNQPDKAIFVLKSRKEIPKLMKTLCRQTEGK